MQQIPDWLERETLLMGEEAVKRLSSSCVAVVGAGGVGAYAAEMLARAGVGRMVIIDSDCVSPSNRNRQLIALESTVGKSKVDVLGDRLRDINPDIEMVLVHSFLTPENISSIFEPFILADSAMKVDFVVDAIDTLSPKLYLIKYCVDSGIPLVSSMGSGAKFDVTKVRIADLSKSFNCPLAHIVRKRLRHMGISKGFNVVFSEEIPDENAITVEESRNKKSQVGSISYLPAVFGCACAQETIRSLTANFGKESRF